MKFYNVKGFPSFKRGKPNAAGEWADRTVTISQLDKIACLFLVIFTEV